MKPTELIPFLSILAVVAALAVAPTAVAQNSSSSGYGGQGGEVISNTNTTGGGAGDPQGSASTHSNTLPFTGLDLTLLVGGGLILFGIGVGMAWLVPRHRAS